jgi:hypothetical protein
MASATLCITTLCIETNSMTTLCIATNSTTSLGLMVLTVMTISLTALHCDPQHNGIAECGLQH